MKLSKRFPNVAEAGVYAAGLQDASDGNVHSIEWRYEPDGVRFDYLVTWIDENKKAAELPVTPPPWTPQQYVAHKGAVCPICHGSDIEGHSIDISDAQAFQPITCLNPDCEASWTDCYELSGYDNLQT